MSTDNNIEGEVPSTWKMASYGFTFLIETILLLSYNLVIAIIIAGVHISTGFVAEAEIQSPSAIWGIRLIGSVFPAIFLVSAFIVVTLWYDLKGEKKEVLKAALKEKGL